MGAPYILGIDIGGTSFSIGSVSGDGSRVAVLRNAPTTPDGGADEVLGRIIALAREVMSATVAAEPGATFVGVGAGAPGPLDTRTGVVLLTPNLGWVDYPLAARLEAGLGLPVVIDNDANCAVLGEWWCGAARGTRHAIGFTIGTGIGGGIIIDGRLHHGASDCAGEIGHTTIDSNGRRCACGNYGCLEAYASGPAIARRATEAIESGAESRMPALVDGDLSLITAQLVYEAAGAGDELAREVVHDTAHFLGAGVANLVNIFNPEVVVVCGGVRRAGDLLFAPLRREVARRAFKPAVAAVRILPSELDVPGVQGAVRAFLDRRDG
ncbi:MAG TPA: ROK family protein [Gemmatimonadales bacterium]|nr:ROK family protein [Gemmatimonadales bacterium]